MTAIEPVTVKEGLTPIPDRFGAVFAKELRQGLRARLFVWPFVAVQVVSIFSVLVEFLISKGGGQTAGFLAIGIFYFVLLMIFAIVLPLTQFGALQTELGNHRNVELLLMSNLTRWQIVRNKWLVGSVLSGLMLISLVPYALTRYFIGGVSLPMSFTLLVGLLISNSVMNGIVIGASGFRNYIVRLILIGLCVVTFSFTTMLCLSPTGLMGGGGGSGVSFSLLRLLGALLLAATSAALYITYGLQLARAQLRLYENPIDPPSSGLIIALIIFTPIIVGVTTLTTFALGGIGGAIGTAGLCVLALLIDRGPGKNSDLRFAQP